MLKIYGAPICKDCVKFKEKLDEFDWEYEYHDIISNTLELKDFLKLRDSLPLFEEVKKKGSIGIPLIICDDGTVTLDWESLVGEKSTCETC